MTTLIPVVCRMSDDQFVGRIEVKQELISHDSIPLCVSPTRKGCRMKIAAIAGEHKRFYRDATIAKSRFEPLRARRRW
jgi:hypothetical protein